MEGRGPKPAGKDEAGKSRIVTDELENKEKESRGKQKGGELKKRYIVTGRTETGRVIGKGGKNKIHIVQGPARGRKPYPGPRAVTEHLPQESGAKVGAPQGLHGVTEERKGPRWAGSGPGKRETPGEKETGPGGRLKKEKRGGKEGGVYLSAKSERSRSEKGDTGDQRNQSWLREARGQRLKP